MQAGDHHTPPSDVQHARRLGWLPLCKPATNEGGVMLLAAQLQGRRRGWRAWPSGGLSLLPAHGKPAQRVVIEQPAGITTVH